MKKRMMKIVCFVVVVMIMIQMLHLIITNGIPAGTVMENRIDDFPSYVTYEVSGENSLEQSFITKYGYLENVKLVFLHVGEEYPGTMHLELKDSSNQVVWQTEKEISDISAGEWATFDIGQNVQMKKLYTLRIYTQQEQEPVLAMLINSAFDISENQNCYYQGQEIPGGLAETFDYRTTYSKIGKTLSCAIVLLIGFIVLDLLFVDDFLNKVKNILFDQQDIKKRYFYIGLGITVLIFLYAHFFKLAEVPYGVNIDEMGMGYDAWSMANFGVDRHLKSFPAYLINFCNGQSSLYMYMAALCIKVFGYSELVLRYPAFVNAILIAVFGALICHERWHKRSIVLLYLVLYSIFPVFIMFTRVGLDCNLMLGFSTMFLYFLMKAVQNGEKKFYVLAGVLAGITLYTYAISYLVMPLFLLFALLYLVSLKKLSIKQFIAFTIPLAVIATPLVLVQIVNMFDLPEFKLGFITITKLPIYREDELGFTHYFQNIYQTLVNILFHDNWHYDSIPKYNTMYWISVPFIVIGLIKTAAFIKSTLQEKKWNINLIILSWLVSVILVGGILDGGSGVTSYKVNGAFFATTYFCVEGLISLFAKLKDEKWIYGAIGTLAIVYGASFISFSEYYYYQYNEETYPSFFFCTTYHDAIETYNALDDSYKDRDVWVEAEGYRKIYFYGSILKSPYEIQYDEQTDGFEKFKFIKDMPEDIDSSVIYLLQEDSSDFAKELEKKGFIVSLVDTRFLCYYPN